MIFKSPQPSALSPVNEHAVSTASAGNNGTKTPEAIAWDLCLQFPRGHRDQCVFGAIDNILNSDEVEVARAKSFAYGGFRLSKGLLSPYWICVEDPCHRPSVVLGKCVTLEGATAQRVFKGPAGDAIQHCGHYSETSNSRKRKRTAAEAPQRDGEDIFKNDEALNAYVRRHGLQQTVTRLHTLGLAGGDCHEPAHKAGRFAYEISPWKHSDLCPANVMRRLPRSG